MHVILLHGALGSAAQMSSLAAELAPRCRVHALEFEGHGDTPTSGGPFRTHHFAENVRNYLLAHELTQVVVFGYSMGGYVALLLAREAPERVAAVLTLGTKLRWNPEFAARESNRLDAASLRTKVPRFADLLASRHRVTGGWETTVERTAEMMRHLGANPDITPETLAAITQPVRLMVGDRDVMVTLEETSEAYRMLPNGELAVLPGTPHPFEQVDVWRVAAHIHEISDAVSGA